MVVISSITNHTHWRAQDPIRSPMDKPVRGTLVVRSVTTSESLLCMFNCLPRDALFNANCYYYRLVGS